ncbi:helix-turn-helix transcriptional regulator [uncultured Brevibacillus sp.]|uniref:helix-turn-helix domain-containing protein n=1 Tax=uncultured Brevibacillus sp. TaxID=169970 RepID=UPI0025923E51|nr:helix-turn-helix transcriptional regulator [uncultured Brevibacillus sp.]
MIKTEAAYKQALEQIRKDRIYMDEQKKMFNGMGLTAEQVTKALEPTISFHEQLKEEVEYYERIKRGEFDLIYNFETIGKTLIAYRIYINMSQNDLAEKLEVSPAQVSRDERNEYFGATIEKIKSVMTAMGMITETRVEPKPLMAV